MKLPNGDRAVVPPEKLEGYCLNQDHPVGKEKARLFNDELGLTSDGAEKLRALLLEAARVADATEEPRNEYGRRFVIIFPVEGRFGRRMLKSAWMLRDGTEVPSLTTCCPVRR